MYQATWKHTDKTYHENFQASLVEDWNRNDKQWVLLYLFSSIRGIPGYLTP